MKTPSKTTRAFTLIELLVVVSIIGILITIAVPNLERGIRQTNLTETLANARSLQQATQMMTLDSKQSGDGLQWTVVVKDGEVTPASLSQYFGALTKDGYLTNSDLRKILSAPGRTPTTGSYNAGNIAFKIYEVSDASPADQVFVTTANIAPPNGAMEPNTQPFGSKGFVFFTKGGGGGIRTRATDATSTNNFPVGESYRYVSLQ